jgi:hypothetical protein
MPPTRRNHRCPTARATPTASAASRGKLPRGDLVPELTLLRTVMAGMPWRPHRPVLGYLRLQSRRSSHNTLPNSGVATTG